MRTSLVDSRLDRHTGVPSGLGRASWTVVVAALMLSCININVHFPRAEIRDAADQIIDDVRSIDSETAQNDEDQNDDGAALDRTAFSQGRSGVLVSLPHTAAVETPAAAQGDDIDKDPVVQKIKESLKERFKKLRDYYDKGAIGESLKGQIELREIDELSLKEKREVKKLREAENTDRMNLYRRVAALKGVPDKVEQVQDVFARRWIAKARKGWWVQKSDKEWVKKTKDPEEKDDDEDDDKDEDPGDRDEKKDTDGAPWHSGSL